LKDLFSTFPLKTLLHYYLAMYGCESDLVCSMIAFIHHSILWRSSLLEQDGRNLGSPLWSANMPKLEVNPWNGDGENCCVPEFDKPAHEGMQSAILGVTACSLPLSQRERSGRV
jgi:hypothetical protein